MRQTGLPYGVGLSGLAAGDVLRLVPARQVDDLDLPRAGGALVSADPVHTTNNGIVFIYTVAKTETKNTITDVSVLLVLPEQKNPIRFKQHIQNNNV